MFLPDGTRVGELDEEMVYESRAGETFLLGASTWRIQEITHERVVVTPAPGQPGKMPFWRGDGPGRPIELGRALGQFVREIRATPRDEALDRLRKRHHLDELAATNLLEYLQEQADVTGAVPDDRTVVVERFRDEIGDWRLCIHTPFGSRVNAPWAISLRERLAEIAGDVIEVMWSDDGIILRLPEALDDLDVEALFPDPDDVADHVVSVLPTTSLFAARFRECSARALLLPRRRIDRRTPLWQQRQRAGDLLAVAAKYPDFPMLLETTRECVNDVFDLPSLIEVLAGVRSRKIRVVRVDTATASPMAQSLLFGWISVYMYEGDAPLAERRAAALSLDRDLLRDLLGDDELRSLVDPEVLIALEDDLQRRSEGRLARDLDEVADLMRLLGPLSLDELSDRTDADELADRSDGVDVAGAVALLVDERRAMAVTVAGEERFADTADAARLRDALGVAIPLGLPTTFTDPVDHPLRDLVERYARTHGPFTAGEVGARFGSGSNRFASCSVSSKGSTGSSTASSDRPEPSASGAIPRSSVSSVAARWRHSVARSNLSRPTCSVGSFLPGRAWARLDADRDALIDTIAQLQGAPLVASTIEADVLPSRLAEYRPADLDALCTSGDVVWVGAGGIGANDGRLRLCFREQARVLVPPPGDDPPSDPHHDAIRAHLTDRGASFWPELLGAVAAAELPYDEATVLAALWDLVWAGEVTNDSLGPLRARLGAKGTGAKGGRARPGRLARQGPPAAAGRWSLVAPMLLPTPSPTEVARRHGVAAPRPLRRADARDGAGRGRGRRVRRGVSGAEGARGPGPRSAGVLRVGTGRGPVRASRRSRPAPQQPGGRGRTAGGARCDRPCPAVRRCAAVARDRRPSGSGGGCSGGALRRSGRGLPRTRRSVGPDLPRPRPARRQKRPKVVRQGGMAGEDGNLGVLVAALGDLAARSPRMELASVDGNPVSDTVLGMALQAGGWRISYRGLRPPSKR